jgi:hypothetical protein
MQNMTEDITQSTIFVQLVLLSGICLCGTACMTIMHPKLKRKIHESEEKVITISSGAINLKLEL